MTISFNAPTDLAGALTGTPLQVALTWNASTFITGADFLLHLDTGFQDTSGNGNVFTGTATIYGGPTPNPDFGAGCAAFVHSSSTYITYPVVASGDGDISGTTDFTVEFWVNTTAVNSGVGTLYSNGLVTLSAGSTGWRLYMQSPSPPSADIVFQTLVEGPGWSGNISLSSGSLSTADGNWHAVAVVRYGNTLTLYVDGVSVSSGLLTTLTGASAPVSMPACGACTLGWDGTTLQSNYFTGFIDEFRLSRFARYTGNYTPAGPFPDDTTAPYGYDIWRNGSSIAQVVGAPGYDDTVPTPSTYDYTVYAWDGTNDVSTVSNTAVVDVTTAVVPNLFNVSVTPVAIELLGAQGLVLGAVTYLPSGIIIAGNILSQSVAAGTVAIAGTPVSVVVSSGLPAPTIPDLFGLTQVEAVTLLESLGLAVGAIGSAPSQFVGTGQVQSQNPSAGATVALGTVVSFVLSTGVPAVGTLFDFEATVISQYANSPTIMQLCNNLNQYVDQSANFANFFNYVWNVLTAVGFGLDIWGAIVNVGRLLQISNSTKYMGFYISSESQPDQDYTPMGSDQDNPAVGGAMYTGYNATQAYLLPDDAYRQLILAKAFANICATTAPAINQILQNLYGPGTAYVLNTGPMSISYNLTFVPTPTQLAILEQSGVIPTPPGVAVTINTGV